MSKLALTTQQLNAMAKVIQDQPYNDNRANIRLAIEDYQEMHDSTWTKQRAINFQKKCNEVKLFMTSSKPAQDAQAG